MNCRSLERFRLRQFVFVFFDELCIENAKASGKLFILNNSAAYGGGIGANGGVTIGEPGDPNVDIVIEKKWVDEENKHNTRPKSIQAELYLNGKRYKTVTLSAEKGWKLELKNLPLGEYEVREAATGIYLASCRMEDLSTKEEEKLLFVLTNTADKNALNALNQAPQTGDGSRIAVWSMLAVAALLGAVLNRKLRQSI